MKVSSMIKRSTRRVKTLDVIPLSDTDVQLRATLVDISVAFNNPDDVELIHDLRIEATVSVPELVIREIAAYALQQPYGQCALSIAPVARLRGLNLKRGYRKHVQNLLGGTNGCTHFLTLAQDLSAANVLSIYLRMRQSVNNTPATRADGSWARAGLKVEPGLVNACLALAEHSPVQRLARGEPPLQNS